MNELASSKTSKGPEKSLRIAGICVFRNAGDLIGLVMLHHLRLMVDHIFCLDNGSIDDGPAKVGWLASRSGRIDLEFDATARPKREYMTALAHRAHREGFDIIVPFDADELWDGTRTRLRQAFCYGHNIVRCAVANFIQRYDIELPSALSWRHACRRCTAVNLPITQIMEGAASFLELEFPSKVVFLGDTSLEVKGGQHSVTRINAVETPCSAIELLHLPMRAKSELLKRAHDFEPRRAQFRLDRGDGWQGLYWQKRVFDGQAESEWQALSYNACGEIIVNERNVATFVDRRLVTHLYRTAFSSFCGFAGLHILASNFPSTAEGQQK